MPRRTRRTAVPTPMGDSTRCVHAGARPPGSTALSSPIYQTATFRLPSAAAGARYSDSVAPGELYTRWGNPTLKRLESALSELEGGEAAIVTSSGMAAATVAILTGLKEGDHVVGGRAAYAGVLEIEMELLPRFGIEATLVENADVESFRRALRPNTKLILVETPANPTLAVTDLAGVVKLAQRYRIRTTADNTFATPINQRPLSLGIDSVFHSMTKALAGHSDVSAGAVVGSEAFIRRAWHTLKLLGPVLNPFDGWLVLRGLRTLSLRVRRQNENAMAIARFLSKHPGVSRVHYPGLPSHAGHRVARRQMSGFGGLLSFDVGDARRVETSTRLIKNATSLGGVESTMESRYRWEGDRVPEGLLRLSVGLEEVEELWADLDQALAG